MAYGVAQPPISADYEDGWSQVATPTGSFRLRRPIHVQMQEEDGVWSHWCEEIGVLGTGTTSADSICSFGEEFLATWDGLAGEEDSKLTGDARSLKRLLLDLVEAIE
ncbi:MAG: hypothetical protein FJ125_11955 [Deltaproteobacteria bacterium]|nr:hypothetical protein [Deltaproteobacteria bacterium]